VTGRIDGYVFRVAGLLIVAVVVGVVIGRPPPQTAPAVRIDPPSESQPDAPDVLIVHVSGEVAAAGLVEVADDARVADVVAAAGGVTADADLSRVNLAETVIDGQQVVIPSSADRILRPGVEQADDQRIRINDAEAPSLESLPGVGPVLARTIVSHRSEYGPFLTVEDLLDVPGIGEQKLASLRDLVIVP
jgi:competence protein ComEA